jgi:pullulanase/glycogen debranching enzyme
MIAFLMASLGIPMLHAGQDFLRSKNGEENTYQKGELNVLDYQRIFQFPGTHNYFSEWIRFRLSPWGSLIRLYSPPNAGYFSDHFLDESLGMAVIYNADGSLGPRRLLFAINPEQTESRVPLDHWSDCAWHQLADQEQFHPDGIRTPFPIDGGVFLPPLGCGLWVTEVH